MKIILLPFFSGGMLSHDKIDLTKGTAVNPRLPRILLDMIPSKTDMDSKAFIDLARDRNAEPLDPCKHGLVLTGTQEGNKQMTIGRGPAAKNEGSQHQITNAGHVCEEVGEARLVQDTHCKI